jgi:hypothetical protein
MLFFPSLNTVMSSASDDLGGDAVKGSHKVAFMEQRGTGCHGKRARRLIKRRWQWGVGGEINMIRMSRQPLASRRHRAEFDQNASPLHNFLSKISSTT